MLFDISYQRSQREPVCVSSLGLAVLVTNWGRFQTECGTRHATGLGVTGNHKASTTIGPCVDIEPLTKLCAHHVHSGLGLVYPAGSVDSNISITGETKILSYPETY